MCNRNQRTKHSPNKVKPDNSTYNYNHPKHKCLVVRVINTINNSLDKLSLLESNNPTIAGHEKYNIAVTQDKDLKISIRNMREVFQRK